MKQKQVLLALAIFTALLCLPATADFSGKVVGVKDGDTIVVMHDGQPENIRLNGVDSPEKSQAFGEKAKQFTSGLCFSKVVTVLVKEQDKYGRTVADIKLQDGAILNQELVKGGLAWWYKQYAPTDTTLKTLEEQARTQKTGLWVDPNPVAPWDFRHGTASTAAASPSVARSGSQEYGAVGGPDANGSYGVSAAPQSGGEEPTVFVTKTGAKYHAQGCRYLKSSSPLPLSQAQARGLTPCSVCGGGGR